ncbi:hypothetical protein QEN19_002011 [Hanseniaspora menglaensis]
MVESEYIPLALNPQCTQILIFNRITNELIVLSIENKRLIFKIKIDKTYKEFEKPVVTFLNETSLLPLSSDLSSLELYNMIKEKLILKIKMVNDATIKSIMSHVDLERLLLVMDTGLIVIYDLLDGLKILDTVDIYKSFDDYQLFSSNKSTSKTIQMSKGGQTISSELINKRKFSESIDRLPESFKNRLISYYKNNSNGNICIVFQSEKLVYTSLIKEEFDVVEDYNRNTHDNSSLSVDVLHTGDVIDTTKVVSGSRNMLEPVEKPKLILRNVVIYNTTTLKFEKILKNLHNSGIETMCLSEDGKILVTCSTKGTIIRCFKIDELDSNLVAKPFAEFRRGSTFAKIEQLVIDSNNEFIAALVSNSEMIHIFNLKDYEKNIADMKYNNSNRFNKYFNKFTKRDNIRHCCHIKRDYNDFNGFKQCILQFERINKKFNAKDDEEISTHLPSLFILYEDSLKSYDININHLECSLSILSPKIDSF